MVKLLIFGFMAVREQILYMLIHPPHMPDQTCFILLHRLFIGTYFR